jgi:outer membrane lipoprotein carrier protein|tara:strand:- start:12708 stop:13379 length:672 start_codon:yes stop_codon:yes gene_type:complete
MKLTLITTVFILFSTITFAQNKDDLTPKDPKAKEILDRMSDKNKTYKSISADFVYKLVNKADGIDETQEGNVFFSGNNYRLKIAGQEIVSNGTTVWTFIEDDGEVQVSDVPDESEDEEGFLNPANIFNVYQKGFKFIYDKEEVIEGKAIHSINLFPINAGEKSYHTIVVKVIKAESQIHSMIVKSKDGNIFTYELKNLKTNLPVTSTTFDFDESRADDVIDLR